MKPGRQAIVIAGSDSSCGAGVAADLEALRRWRIRPQLVVSAVTAQTSAQGLHACQPVAPESIRAQFAAARKEIGPHAEHAPVKVGMLPNAAAIETVATLLAQWQGLRIVDPVAGPAGGGSWADAAWISAFLRWMPQACDVLAPNLAEAQLLAGCDERASASGSARILLQRGFSRVLVTDARPEDPQHAIDELYADASGERLVLSSPRVGYSDEASLFRTAQPIRRGTGCTLTAAIAAAAAWRIGRGRPTPQHNPLGEALVLGKMHASEYWSRPALLQRPSAAHLPQIETAWMAGTRTAFPQLNAPLGVCPLTDDPGMIATYARIGFSAAQLRIKGTDAKAGLQRAAALAAESGIRLFANDAWQEAIRLADRGVHGVHLGQADLQAADLAAIAAARLRLGVSIHDWFELAVACSVAPSYVSLGPAYAANSKDLPALGLREIEMMLHAKCLPHAAAIGGINETNAALVARRGIRSVACIRATADADAAKRMLEAWNSCTGAEQAAG